jgi:hypothetical protein
MIYLYQERVSMTMESVENFAKEDVNCFGQTLSTPTCSLLFFCTDVYHSLFWKRREGRGRVVNLVFL